LEGAASNLHYVFAQDKRMLVVDAIANVLLEAEGAPSSVQADRKE